MFLNLSRKIFTIFLMLCFLTVNFNISPNLISYIVDKLDGENIVDKVYLAKQNKNVVDNFKSILPQAEAALDSAELEYMVDIGPISGSTTSGYVYASIFNPSASGRSISIKRIAVKANAVNSANYVNLSVRRTTAASAGTQISVGDIPKKNNSSSNSIAEVRHTGVTTTMPGVADSRIMGQPMPGAAGQFFSYRDITFGADDEKLVLRPGEGVALYQEAAGDIDQRIRLYAEWEETVATPTAGDEFLFAFPRVEVAATAGYVYNSFFNPATSGKTAVIKRIWFGAETCDTTAVYTNNISLRRTTAASGGTAITASNVPKKNTGSSNSVMDFRRSGPTVTFVGTAEARLGLVTACAAAGQPHGFMQINLHDSDEKIILQQGEGIALYTETVGDVDQLTRMIVEWEEVASASTPSSQGEYFFNYLRVSNEAVAPALNTTFYTFFNPAASGKTAVVKRLGIRVNADTTATYSAFNWRRLSAASGGSQVAATDVIKKHSSTSNSAMELRSCGATCGSAITATYSGTADSRLLTTNGAGTLAQVIGQREIVFGESEKLILQPGEGVGFYLDVVAGDIDHYVKAFVEWDEQSSTPTAAGEYLLNVGPINGSTTSGYNYASFFNPSASGKTTIIKKISLRIDTQSTAVYIPMTVRRISSASGGTQITTTNIPKKNNSSANSIMEIRRTGVTVGLLGGADSRLFNVQTPGTTGAATAPSINGYREFDFENDERVILQPGEGVALYQELAGDADFRVKVLFEWEEVASASTPSSEGEYLLTTGPINGDLNANYVYSSFFNPNDSGKNYVVKRMEIRANRVGTLVAPGYIPVTIRKTSAASGGTTITQANVPKKHSGTSNTTAQINHTGPTVTFTGAAESRLLGVTVPGVVRQYGDYENIIVYGDELILQPGEGFALYQEATAGDALLRFQMTIQWSESTATSTGSLAVDIVDSGGSSVTTPSVNFSSANFNWGTQQSTATMGITAEKIRVTNTTSTPSWTLSIAGTVNTNLWTSGGNTYDFNDTSVTGRLNVNPGGVTITPQGGCNNTGLTNGSTAYFVQGTQDSINLITAGASAGTNCYWDVTGVEMTQDIPAAQAIGNYSLNLILSVI